MKYLFAIFLASVALSSWANSGSGKYKLKISYYEGFSGAGPRFRREEVITQVDGQEAVIASKIYLDETNELRETNLLNPEGKALPEDNKKRKEMAEEYFKLATPGK